MSGMSSPPNPLPLSMDRPSCFVCNRTSDNITAAQLFGLLIIYCVTSANYSLQKKNIYLELPGWFDSGKYVWIAAAVIHVILKICINGGNFQSNGKEAAVDGNEISVKWSLVWAVGMLLGKGFALWLTENMLLAFLYPVKVEQTMWRESISRLESESPTPIPPDIREAWTRNQI